MGICEVDALHHLGIYKMCCIKEFMSNVVDISKVDFNSKNESIATTTIATTTTDKKNASHCTIDLTKLNESYIER